MFYKIALKKSKQKQINDSEIATLRSIYKIIEPQNWIYFSQIHFTRSLKHHRVTDIYVTTFCQVGIKVPYEKCGYVSLCHREQ